MAAVSRTAKTAEQKKCLRDGIAGSPAGRDMFDGVSCATEIMLRCHANLKPKSGAHAVRGANLRRRRRIMTDNYEVIDILEVGDAGATIRDKDITEFDELGQPSGVARENLADE